MQRTAFYMHVWMDGWIYGGIDELVNRPIGCMYGWMKERREGVTTVRVCMDSWMSKTTE